jgi:hypothetical protein
MLNQIKILNKNIFKKPIIKGMGMPLDIGTWVFA